MTEEQRRQFEEGRKRLQQLERWRAALVGREHDLDEQSRRRLAQKIALEHAHVQRILEPLRQAASSEELEGLASTTRDRETPVGDSDRKPHSGGWYERDDQPSRRKHRVRRGRRALLTAVAAVVLVVVIGGYVASLRLDSHAEALVDEQLREVIEQSGLGELISYSRVEVNSLFGRVRFFDVSLVSANPRSQAHADELRLQMSPNDLVRIARNRETAVVSGVRVSVIGGSVADSRRAADIEFKKVGVDLTGNFPLESIDRPEAVRFTKVHFVVEGVGFSDAESGFSGRIEEAGYTVSGDFTVADLNGGSQRLLARLESLDARIGGASIGLSGMPARELEEFQVMLGGYGWIADLDNWSIEDSRMRMLIEPDILSVDSFRFVSPLLSVDGTLEIALDTDLEPAAVRGELQVNEIHHDIRAFSRLYFSMAGYSIPSDGPFTVGFVFEEHSGAHVEIL